MSAKSCIEIRDLAFPISVRQEGVDRFTVTYGEQVRRGLSYAEAAHELGECVFHALACDGRLDNRLRGERPLQTEEGP